MDDLVTIDSILDTFKKWVEEKQPIDNHLWVDAARKLNVLVGDEQGKLYDMEHSLANYKLGLLDSEIGKKMSVAEIKMRSEASPIFKDIQLLKAKIGRVQEHIRIAKLQARMSSEESKNW